MKHLLNMLQTIIFCTALFLCACTNKPAPSPKSDLDPVKVKIDKAYSQIADLTIEQVKLANKVAKDEKVTAAIAEYSKVTTAGDKSSILDRLVPIGMDEKTDEPQYDKPFDGRHGEFLTRFNLVPAKNFDLAIAHNDMAAEQVNLMNKYFKDLDKETLDAVAYYQKLSKEDKVNFFLRADAVIKPVPDYYQKFVGKEFLNVYFRQKYLAINRLQTYLQRTNYINEFPQGFSAKELSMNISDKQFDLRLAAK